jgi:lipoprotein NlpI
MRQGSNFRALEDYAKAIELDPTYSQAYKNRGVGDARNRMI